jgi:hypothetical protein
MLSKSQSLVISMFDLPLPLRFLILALLFPSSSPIFNVKADSAGLTTLTNMTIDDNATQSILYSLGQWSLSSSYSSLDYGGFHHLSDQSSAFAVFNFTGVSVYFLSPLWPYSVGAQLVLDGNEPTFVDLQDHSKPTSLTGGPETVSSMVVWQAENLNEGNHTLRVEFAQGKAEYVVLDGLIYSYNVQNPPSSSSSSVMPSSTFSPSISSTPTVNQRATSSSTTTSTQSSTTPVIVGAIVGAIIGIFGIIFVMILIRYRGRISARFPQIFGTVGITVEAEPPEDRDFERSIASMSATNEATVLSATSHSAERLVPLNPSKATIATASAPTKATSSANNLRSPSRSTVAPSTPASTSSRPLLPPINTKQLPPLPPLPDVESESTSALNYRSLMSAVSKRITALTGIPQSGSSSSASSSFFPRPILDEDRGMLSISRQQSLRRATDPSSSSDTSPDMLKTVVSRVGTYPGATDKKVEGQETRRFPAKPVREVVQNSSSKARVPSVPVVATAESVPNPQAMSSSATNRPTLPPLSAPSSSFARKKAANPLMIIPENSISRGSGEGDSSPRTPSKRLSGGKIRMEKERQRRRHPRTPVTPQGPRSRPLPSPPASTPLPSSSSNMWSTESVAATSPRTPLTPNSQARRRRPLPHTLPEARRSSAILDPHMVVPSKNSRRKLTPVTVQSSPIGASIPASSAALSNDDTHDPVPEMSIESEDQTIFTQLPEGDAESQSPSLENDSEPAPLESPDQPLQLPTLPPLPSMQPFSAFLSLDTTTAPSRPRGGQHEHSLSLPSSWPSHIPHTPPIDSPSSSRGPLPTPPLSARSAPDGGTADNGSPRSQRRLPPQPLKLNNSRTRNVPFARLKEIPETQYLTIPEDLNGEQSAPPPYSGRRSRLLQPSTSTAVNHLATSIRTPAQRLLAREGAIPGPAELVSGNQRKDLSQTFNKQQPHSVPETPSDWRTSSYRQSSSSALRHGPTTNEPEPDETAADLLFELLDGSDGASIATARTISPSPSTISIRPLSYPVRVSRALSAPPSPPPSSSRIRTTVSLSSDPRQEQDESQIPPVPPIPTVAITTEISISRETASRLPPPSPRSPLLTIPPHPTTPPPPVPTTRARRKVWNAQGVSQQRLSSSTKDSSYF